MKTLAVVIALFAGSVYAQPPAWVNPGNPHNTTSNQGVQINRGRILSVAPNALAIGNISIGNRINRQVNRGRITARGTHSAVAIGNFSYNRVVK